MCFHIYVFRVCRKRPVVWNGLNGPYANLQSYHNLLSANPKNGQTHSNNSSYVAHELFECVWLFCGVGT